MFEQKLITIKSPFQVKTSITCLIKINLSKFINEVNDIYRNHFDNKVLK